MVTITTPRPPLNLFEVVRAEIGVEWTTIYDVPDYLIPAEGPNPARSIGTAAIMTGVLITPAAEASAQVSIRVLAADNTPWLLLDRAFAPSGDVLSIGLDRQVLKSGERFQMKVEASEVAVAHFSFILNQREDFTVIA
jgi:hypothetical protein